jgi:hypothetical protein
MNIKIIITAIAFCAGQYLFQFLADGNYLAATDRSFFVLAFALSHSFWVKS